MRVIKVDGVAIPSPNKDFEIGLQDISDDATGRSESALMYKNIIAQKRTIDLSWTNIEDSISKKIYSLIKSKTYVSLTYPSPETGADMTITAYTGDIKATFKFQANNKCFWDVSIGFVEK